MEKIAGTTLVAFGVMGLVAFGVGSASAVTYTGTLTCAGGGLTGVFMLDKQERGQLTRPTHIRRGRGQHQAARSGS